MQPPVLIVVGPPHHGKTEARKILSELTFLKGESTSTVIYEFLAIRRKVSIDELRQLEKEFLRPELIEAGDFLVGARADISLPAVDPEIDKIVYRIPSALIRTLYMSGYNIIDGVRRKTELKEAVNHLNWNGVRSVVVWIERPGVEKIQDNTELSQADATDVVFNDGTLEDLRAQLKLVLEKHFGKQDEKPQAIPVFDSPEAAAAAHGASPVNLAAQVARAKKVVPNEL